MQKLTENDTCSSNICFRTVINISGRVSRICAVDRESRVQDKDVGSFPVTRHSAGEASKIIEVTVKRKSDALSRFQRRLVYQFTYVF